MLSLVNAFRLSEQNTKIIIELPGYLRPGIDWNRARRIVCDTTAKRRIGGEFLDKRRIVAVLRKKRRFAVLEEVVRLAVVCEDRLLPAKVLLQLGIAVLIGSAHKCVRLAHHVELFFLREPTEKDAVVAGILVEVFLRAPRQIEFDVPGQFRHRRADVVGTLPFCLVTGIDDVEAPFQLDVPRAWQGFYLVGAVGNVLAFHPPPAPDLLEFVA